MFEVTICDLKAASSSAAGSPVRSTGGRTLAAIPKSIIQTSPGLTPRIFLLHPVEYQRPLERCLIAESHVGVLIGDFQQPLANSSPLGFAQLREFLDDFRCAHDKIIASVRGNSSGNFFDEKGESAQSAGELKEEGKIKN